jgi:hypothetical protein
MATCDLRQMVTVTSNAVPGTLTYSLLNPPAGATIDTNGVISWTPNAAQAPSTNVITTVVTDNGIPPLSTTNHFTVTVTPLTPFRTLSVVVSNDVASITCEALTGQTYHLQYKDNLSDANWQDALPDVTATGPTVTLTHLLGSAPFRFFRVQLLP